MSECEHEDCGVLCDQAILAARQPEPDPPEHRRGIRLPPGQREEIAHLLGWGVGIKPTAKRLGISHHTVRAVAYELGKVPGQRHFSLDEGLVHDSYGIVDRYQPDPEHGGRLQPPDQ